MLQSFTNKQRAALLGGAYHGQDFSRPVGYYGYSVHLTGANLLSKQWGQSQVFGASPLNPQLLISWPDERYVSNSYIGHIHFYGTTNLRAVVSLAAWEEGRWAPHIYATGTGWHQATPIWVYPNQTTTVRMVLQHPQGALRVESTSRSSVQCYDWESGQEVGEIYDGMPLFSALTPGQFGVRGEYIQSHLSKTGY